MARMLIGLSGTLVAWIWIGYMIREVATRQSTFFDPVLGALGLIALATAATYVAVGGWWRDRGMSRPQTGTAFWTSTLTVWAIALVLPLITLRAIS